MSIKSFFCVIALSAFCAITAGLLAGCAPKNAAKTAPADGAFVAGKVFVPASWVKSVIDGGEPQSGKAVIIEASWGEAGDAYKKAHIPGALHLNTDLIEEEKLWNIRTPEEIAKTASDFGITKDTPVIIYGNDSGATRVAFVLLWAGVNEVYMLNGGYKAWIAAGYPTSDAKESAKAAPQFGAVIPAHPEYLMSLPEEVIKEQRDNPNFVLASIRSWDEFTGKTSGYNYIDRAGEPKGAVWGRDEADFYNEDGTVKALDAVQKDYWDEWGITQDKDIAFYCGTGWRATVPWLLCYENGWKNIKLYDGGWFVWQMNKDNPVQTGDVRTSTK